MLETAVVGADNAQVKDGLIRIEALPARVYQTPQYGEVPITRDKLDRFVKNFNDGVRGQDISTDFDHGMDRAKGNKASGWYRGLEVGPSSNDPNQLSLFALVEPTTEARKEIEDKQWKYFSLTWEDSWSDNNGQVFNDVVTGGAFTNVPIAKNTMPINFSEALWKELDLDTQKQFAVWPTATVDNLPDSSFLHVEPGTKDSSGKTTPRTKRHFPIKDASGKIDLPHLRNAIARIPQATISAPLKTALQSKARSMLSKTSKMYAEGAVVDIDTTMVDELIDSILNESKEWERSTPGTGSPPAPDLGPEIVDPTITEGWRTDPLPLDPNAPGAPSPNPAKPNTNSEGGETVLSPEQIAALKKALGIKDDATDDEFVTAATVAFSEHAEFKKNLATSSEEKTFAEQHPTMWAEHVKLLDKDRTNEAKTFSESVVTVKTQIGDRKEPTSNGLSALALETIANNHKKFAEGKGTLADFEESIKVITDGGIVKFGEQGSSVAPAEITFDTSSKTGLQASRKMFAEAVNTTIREFSEKNSGQSMDYMEAVRVTSIAHPDLAKAYQLSSTT